MTEFVGWISAIVLIALGLVSLIGVYRHYELLPQWSILLILVSGYVSGCLGLLTMSSKFAANTSANFNSFVDAYQHSFILLPGGFAWGIITVGLTAFLARYHKAWPILPVAMLALSHLWFWVQRDQFLSAEGFAAQNRWNEVVAIAARPDRSFEDAFDVLLDHARVNQIPETADTRDRMYALLGDGKREHQKIAVEVIAEGKWKLVPEALFHPGTGHDIDQEYWLARQVVRALLSRTQRNPLDPDLETAWESLYSKSRRYKLANNSQDVSELGMVDLPRTNAVGEIWQLEIAKAAKAEPRIARWLRP